MSRHGRRHPFPVRQHGVISYTPPAPYVPRVIMYVSTVSLIALAPLLVAFL